VIEDLYLSSDKLSPQDVPYAILGFPYLNLFELPKPCKEQWYLRYWTDHLRLWQSWLQNASVLSGPTMAPDLMLVDCHFERDNEHIKKDDRFSTPLKVDASGLLYGVIQLARTLGFHRSHVCGVALCTRVIEDILNDLYGIELVGLMMAMLGIEPKMGWGDDAHQWLTADNDLVKRLVTEKIVGSFPFKNAVRVALRNYRDNLIAAKTRAQVSADILDVRKLVSAIKAGQPINGHPLTLYSATHGRDCICAASLLADLLDEEDMDSSPSAVVRKEEKRCAMQFLEDVIRDDYRRVIYESALAYLRGTSTRKVDLSTKKKRSRSSGATTPERDFIVLCMHALEKWLQAKNRGLKYEVETQIKYEEELGINRQSWLRYCRERFQGAMFATEFLEALLVTPKFPWDDDLLVPYCLCAFLRLEHSTVPKSNWPSSLQNWAQ
jgi:hypothetical protein